MARLIKKVYGKKAYLGLLSPEEIEEANKMQKYLEKYIPTLEKTLKEKYKERNVAYAHEFGTELRKLVAKFNIKGKIQEQIFWDQIKDFASKDEDRPQDRQNRKVYDYYYRLSFYELDEIRNINWSEWSYLFDIKEVMKEERIIDWLAIKAKKYKISRKPFRLLMTGIRVYIENKDTKVFRDEQLYEKYDLIFKITDLYLKYYDEKFTKKNRKPTSARIKNQKKYREKYFREVLMHKRKNKNLELEDICEEVFNKIYLINER